MKKGDVNLSLVLESCLDINFFGYELLIIENYPDENITSILLSSKLVLITIEVISFLSPPSTTIAEESNPEDDVTSTAKMDIDNNTSSEHKSKLTVIQSIQVKNLTPKSIEYENLNDIIQLLKDAFLNKNKRLLRAILSLLTSSTDAVKEINNWQCMLKSLKCLNEPVSSTMYYNLSQILQYQYLSLPGHLLQPVEYYHRDSVKLNNLDRKSLFSAEEFLKYSVHMLYIPNNIVNITTITSPSSSSYTASGVIVFSLIISFISLLKNILPVINI